MRFDYLQPATLGECVALLEKYGRRAKVIAGGTDLVLNVRARLLDPECVIDISGIPSLSHIEEDDGGLRIGAAVTVRDVSESPLIKERYPLLATACGLVGSVGIRNVATIGGNVCRASPSSECSPSLLCLGAEARIAGPGGERTICLDECFLGPGCTTLEPDEVLCEILLPPSPPGTRSVYLKHSQRGSIDLAIVGVAAVGTFAADGNSDDIKIALGAVAPTPIRARDAERVLQGKVFDDGLVAEAAEAAKAEARPISDVRASAEYRQEMVGVFVRKALRTIRPD
jgi:aerobic carbon-monoxide dehydrogenase medium subunit